MPKLLKFSEPTGDPVVLQAAQNWAGQLSVSETTRQQIVALLMADPDFVAKVRAAGTHGSGAVETFAERSPKPGQVSPERRRQLLSKGFIGKLILANEKKGK